MTPEQIRAQEFETDNGEWESARWLQELAAQVAESNQLRREALTLATESQRLHAEDSESRKTQLSQLTSAQTLISDSIAKQNAAMPMPVRIVLPGDPESPQHLGCVYRMPDNSYGLVNNAGAFVPLPFDETMAKAVIAMLKNPEPGEPQ